MIKNKGKNLLNYLPFLVYTLLIIILHINMTIRADDEYIINVIQQMTLKEWIVSRYIGWSSRIIIDIIMLEILSLKYIVWKILNIGIFALLPYSINKLFNSNNNLRLKWFIYVVTLLIPWVCYGGAGWAATSINYLWTLVFGILACIPIKKNFNNEKLTISEKIISILSLIFATNHEQLTVILGILYGLTLIYNLVRKNKNNWIWLYISIVLLSAIFIVTCPGNHNRIAVETYEKLPMYQTFNFFDKIQVGITSMMTYMVLERNFVFLTTTLIMMFAVFATNKSRVLRAVSIIPFVGSMIPLNTINKILPNNLVILKDAINKFNVQTLVSELFENNMIMFYVIFIYYLIILVSMVISIYAIFKKTDKSIFAITLFAVGLISRLILGFSPTVYVSGERTLLFVYASCIILIIYIWKYLNDMKKDNKPLNTIILSLCLVAYVQNLLAVIKLH